jgi:acetylornithine deacetylase
MDTELLALTQALVRIDSRRNLSNIPIAERIEAELAGFEIERIDYTDAAGVTKRALVAHRGPAGGFGLSGHMDPVPAIGWESAPWFGRFGAGILHGLGSPDMKGAVAACILAARRAPKNIGATLLLTADEETTKAGAQAIAARSELARAQNLRGIFVAEPTSLIPVRGHRVHIQFKAEATGVQAHSSTGQGSNANWAMIPFLAEMKAVFERLRSDPTLQDTNYDPPFSDFNLVLDNHGTANNVTVALATAHIKFRYSHGVDPQPILDAVRSAARRAGLSLTEAREGAPPELALDHPLVALAVRHTNQPATTAPYGTDASELQGLAPCVVLGPGSIATAHTPHECVALADLEAACELFGRIIAAE